MPQIKFKNIITTLHNFIQNIYTRIPTQQIINFCGSSWRLIAIIFCAITFLYYPLGGLIINNIDTDTSVEISTSDTNHSATLDTISYLIRREVNDKIWTPNLPFFFPSYFLDNMPEFQLGLIKGLSNFTTILSEHWEQKVSTKDEQLLTQTAKLLQYPPQIWMFSPDNKLMPVPSAHSQYRKARKLIIKFNQELSNGNSVLYLAPQDLTHFLTNISNTLQNQATKIEAHIRENSSAYVDTQADNLFYYSQGLAYANYLLLKALAVDYKDILIKTDIYLEWTHMLKALENATQIKPLIVRNGKISSFVAPNHLSSEGFYILKAYGIMQHITNKLEKFINTNKE